MKQQSTRKKRSFCRYYLALFCLVFSIHARAQEEARMKGTVLSETGEPLAGVTVMMNETKSNQSQSTMTDAKGIFTFDQLVAGSRYDVHITYIGYQVYESKGFLINDGDNNSLLVRMAQDAKSLSDVVVVGYGTQSKTKVTGAISQVKSEDLNKYKGSNFVQQLAGKASGVVINDASSQPGTDPQIVIRGVGTLTAGNNPLVVVDGFPLSEGSSLNSINPQDIETIDILKDPASAAIYGSRAANGVILVTTKKGKAGKATISFDAFTGIQERSDKVKLTDAYQSALFFTEARDYSYVSKNPQERSITDDAATRKANGASKRDLRYNYIDPYLNNEPGLTNTDWMDEIFRVAPINSYNLSVSGSSSPNSSYYISANYFNQKGIVIGTGLERYSATIKINAQPLSWLKTGVNIIPSYNKQKYFPNTGSRGADPIGSALIMYPFFSAYNEDGSLAISKQIDANTPEDGALMENPVAIMEKTKYNRNYFRNFGNAFLDISLIDGLKFKTMLGADYTNNFIDYFSPSDVGAYRTAAPKPATATETNAHIWNYLFENTLTYTKTLGDHDLSLLGGYTFQKESSASTEVTGAAISDDNLTNISGASNYSVIAARYVWAQVSYLARAQYAFRNKYLFTAAIRRDGSSRFGKDSKWGNFPSLTGGWILTNESFMPKTKWLDLLKVRATWGKAGNNQIGSYSSLALVNPDNYVFGNTLAPGFAAIAAANAALSWETKSSYNIGIDIGLFHKLTFSANYYNTITTDLLLEVPVPEQSGFSSALQNLGKVRNRGIELDLGGSNIRLGKISWNFNANMATNSNRVLALAPNQKQIITGSNNAFLTRVGGPIAELYGYHVTGIYKSQQEIDNSPHMTGTLVGDYIMKDVNGDGKITTDDRETFGTYAPSLTYGFDNSFSLGNFALSFSFVGVAGRKIYDASLQNMESGESFTMSNQYYFENRYHPVDNPDGFLAQPNTNFSPNRLNGNASNMFFYNADYLRLRNLQLAYNLPVKSLSGVKISSLSVYASVNNLVTITGYRGFNPDATTANVLTSGYSSANYPVAKTYTLGLNLTF